MLELLHRPWYNYGTRSIQVSSAKVHGNASGFGRAHLAAIACWLIMILNSPRWIPFHPSLGHRLIIEPNSKWHKFKISSRSANIFRSKFQVDQREHNFQRAVKKLPPTWCVLPRATNKSRKFINVTVSSQQQRTGRVLFGTKSFRAKWAA